MSLDRRITTLEEKQKAAQARADASPLTWREMLRQNASAWRKVLRQCRDAGSGEPISTNAYTGKSSRGKNA